MSNVFVSYARSTEAEAEQVARALRAKGYDVWRDDELPAHRTYADVIEERLTSAKAVVVLWSAEAARSQWVRAEADAARELGTLVQASVDGTPPPIPFNQIQCADLKGWTGEDGNSGWRKLTGSVAALAGKAQPDHWPKPRERSICVLAFANMSGDSEQEYFSDGISEDITTDLSKISALAVTARNTAFTFKGQSVNVTDVARELGVRHVLEGSVRKAGNRVRITAQLIDGATGDHVWADRYDRDLIDIFAIQDEISKAIVQTLKLKLMPEEKKAIEHRGTNNVEAYNLYLMARNQWATGNHGDVHRENRVIRFCERALTIDPNYAGAWALLSVAQSNRRYGLGLVGDDGVAAAEKALTIDPNIAEAHCPIIRRYIEQRRYKEAEANLARALKGNPDSWEIQYEGARVRVYQRHFEEAAYHLEKCVSIMETDYYAWGILLWCYRALGDRGSAQRAARTALEQAENALAHDGNNGSALSIKAYALAALGDADSARDLIERGMLLDQDNLDMSYIFAAVYAAYLDDREAALALLEPIMAKAKGALISWAAIDPDIDCLRDDSRFQSMLSAAQKRLGLESA